MFKNYCCNNWVELVPRIQELVYQELVDVQPKYIVLPILKVVDKIGNVCPVCGEELLVEESTVDHLRLSPRKKPSSSQQETCNVCNGTGSIGTGEDDIPIACQVCLGSKKVKREVQGVNITKQMLAEKEKENELEVKRLELLEKKKNRKKK